MPSWFVGRLIELLRFVAFPINMVPWNFGCSGMSRTKATLYSFLYKQKSCSATKTSMIFHDDFDEYGGVVEMTVEMPTLLVSKHGGGKWDEKHCTLCSFQIRPNILNRLIWQHYQAPTNSVITHGGKNTVQNVASPPRNWQWIFFPKAQLRHLVLLPPMTSLSRHEAHGRKSPGSAFSPPWGWGSGGGCWVSYGGVRGLEFRGCQFFETQLIRCICLNLHSFSWGHTNHTNMNEILEKIWTLSGEAKQKSVQI